MRALSLADEELRALVADVWASLFAAGASAGLAGESVDLADAEESPLSGEVVAGFVDISGGWNGRVVVETTRAGALAVAAEMFAVPAADLEPGDLADAIGELANIVGGSVKSCVDGCSTLSLPSVEHVPAEPPRIPHSLQVTTLWREFPLRVRVQSNATSPTPMITGGRTG